LQASNVAAGVVILKGINMNNKPGKFYDSAGTPIEPGDQIVLRAMILPDGPMGNAIPYVAHVDGYYGGARTDDRTTLFIPCTKPKLQCVIFPNMAMEDYFFYKAGTEPYWDYGSELSPDGETPILELRKVAFLNEGTYLDTNPT
jgi:hypothetical protein